MELRFGRDFSHVRVHTDSRAAESARQVDALAYTVGPHVVFGAGRFAPETQPGRRLLAHELTHVIQDHGRSVERTAPPELRVDRRAEREADAVGERVAQGRVAALGAPVAGECGSPTIQRQEADTSTTGTTKEAGSGAVAGAAAAGAAAVSAGCVQRLSGAEFETVLRLDTITAIILSMKFCGPCDSLKRVIERICGTYQNVRHPLQVRFYVLDVDPMKDNGDRITTPDAEKNREIGERFGAPPAPHLLIYVEHELKDHTDGYLGSPEIYERKIANTIEDTTETGTQKGLKIGGWTGGITGVIAGVATAMGLAAGGMGAGLAALAGLGIAAGLTLVGLGLGALFGWLFGEARGTAELSAERIVEVKTFIAALAAVATSGTEGPERSDALARDAVDYSVNNPSDLPLTVEVRRELIKILLEGATLDADERAIIKILENSEPNEILDLLDPAKGVSFQDLDANIHGSEWSTTREMLRKRFPDLGRGTGIRRAGVGECTAEQAIMAYHARQRGVAMVKHARDRLSDYLADPAANENVEGPLGCYFPGATKRQIGDVRDRLDQVHTRLPGRVYYCASGPMGGFVVTRPGDGREVVISCIGELAAGIVGVGGNVLPEVYLCGEFFSRQTPVQQAITVIHETVHATGLLEDPRYHPPCGVPIETALRNPDSYSYLAAAMERV